MNNKLKPALIGGVLLGLLSAIPVVNLVNVCCCLWALIGGLLASYLYIKNSPVPASAGDGAILGALAGLVGAVIVVVIGIPISIIAGGITRELLVCWVYLSLRSARDRSRRHRRKCSGVVWRQGIQI